MAEPTREDRDRAARLLDDLTFGGHSQDGAISVLAQALAEASQGADGELVELRSVRQRAEDRRDLLAMDAHVHGRELRIMDEILGDL